MSAELAAAYVGERSVSAFETRVRSGEYPAPVVNSGKRRLWLKEDLDKAITRTQSIVADLAEDL
jgi:hypothetical protein